MKNSNYSIFSKEELIDFLDNYDDRFKSVFSVYKILMQKKIDMKNKEIQENLNKGTKIYDVMKNTDDLSKKMNK